jgi:pyridoxamine 5'-phosphate oxidase
VRTRGHAAAAVATVASVPVLDESEVAADPLEQFRRWFAEAEAAGVADHDAMVVATADRAGAPSARVVLLRGFDDDGFRFFTNYDSAKGVDLAENPRAALVWHWREQGRQVRATGSVSRLPPDDSQAYWRNGPMSSRISASASRQSQPVASRAALEAAAAEVAERLGDDVPLPSFWGGYLVSPDAVEFWQHRDDRLHDRLRYRRVGQGWLLERLQP